MLMPKCPGLPPLYTWYPIDSIGVSSLRFHRPTLKLLSDTVVLLRLKFFVAAIAATRRFS